MPISPNNLPLSLPEQPGDAQSTPANSTSTEITHYDDGSGTMRTPNNTVIERDANGNFNIHFPSLKRVEIADITTIVSHQINRVLNSTSHVIHFVGGGFFTMAYDQHGNLLSSQSRKVVCKFTDDGVIRLERSFQEHDLNRVVFNGKEL